MESNAKELNMPTRQLLARIARDYNTKLISILRERLSNFRESAIFNMTQQASLGKKSVEIKITHGFSYEELDEYKLMIRDIIFDMFKESDLDIMFAYRGGGTYVIFEW
jgi:hypothetical protein